MKRFVSRVVTLTVLALLLTGCGAGERSKRLETEVEMLPLPDIATPAGLSEIWSEDVGTGKDDNYLDLTPAFFDGVVFVVSAEGVLKAVNGTDGSTVWRQDVGETVSAGVGVGRDLVLVADSEGHIHAFNRDDGKLVWTSFAGGEVLTPPVVSATTVIVRTVAGRVSGLRTIDGERRWAFQRSVPGLSLRGTSPPAVYEGIALTSFASGKLVATDVETGNVLWEYDVVSPTGRNEIERMVDLDATPILVGSVLYVAGYQSEVVALALGSRKVLWRKPVSSFLDIAADDDSIYITAQDGNLFAFNRLTGDERWTQPALRGRSDTGPTLHEDMVLIGSNDGLLHVLSKDSGVFLDRLKIGDPLTSRPLSDGQRIYAQSENGRLFAFQRKPGG